MSEYPEVYIDDLGFHYTISFNDIDDIIKHSIFDEKGNTRTVTRYEHVNCPGRDYNYWENQKITFYDGLALAASSLTDKFKMIPGVYRCWLNSPSFHMNMSPPSYGIESKYDLQNMLFPKIAKVWDEKFGTKYAQKYQNKRPTCQVFEGVYIPSDIMMKQNQKRFDEYRQQIQHQQEEINKLNKTITQQNEQIKQLTDTNAKLSNENEILTQKQTIIDRETQHNENVLSNIHEQVINVLKSYGGNWVMNAFSPQRQEEVLNYLYHRYKTISTSDLKKAFDSILDELSNINLKPFGE